LPPQALKPGYGHGGNWPILSECVVLREIDFLLTCGVKLREYRYLQIWIIAKWKQSPVGWFFESLQKT